MRDQEDRRDQARGALAGVDRRMSQTPADVEREIRERLENWRAMLRPNVPQGRQGAPESTTTPLRFQPVGETGVQRAGGARQNSGGIRRYRPCKYGGVRSSRGRAGSDPPDDPIAELACNICN